MSAAKFDIRQNEADAFGPAGELMAMSASAHQLGTAKR
jgi:hypothetical protein